MTPRGIRNHNPGNIRHGDPWQGLAADQPDREFAAFVSPEWGIRAIARLLISYRDRHGLTTIRGIIARWAPPAGRDSTGAAYQNDVGAYARHVSKLTGLSPDQDIDVTRYEYARPLVEAIIRHENGQQPYSARLIDRGLELAGIDVPGDPLLHRPEGQAAVVVGGTAGVAVISETLASAAPALPVISILADRAPWLIGIGLLAAVGWIVFTRWKDSA